MRFSTIALAAALVALAGSAQGSLNFPVLNSCSSGTQVNPIAMSLNTSSCKNLGFSTLVASLLQATGLQVYSTDSLVSPLEVHNKLPTGLSQTTLTNEHIEFIEQLSPNFKFVREFFTEDLASSVIANAESGETFAFVAIRDDNGESTLALISDAVDDGSEAVRVIHPTKGYVAVDVNSIVGGYEFSYETSTYSSEGQLGSPHVPFSYPLYSQCDGRWKNNMMVNRSICAVGCLMSSVSMAIAGHNVQFRVGGTLYSSNPGTFNSFVKSHGGYVGNNLFVHGVVNQVCSNSPSPGCNIRYPSDGSHSGRRSIPLATLQHYITSRRAVVGNVKNGGHFVLLVGWDTANSDRLLANDPAGGVNKYFSYSSDVVGYKIYDMKGPRITDAQELSVHKSTASKPWNYKSKKFAPHSVIPKRRNLFESMEDETVSDGYKFSMPEYEAESNSFEEIDEILDSLEYI